MTEKMLRRCQDCAYLYQSLAGGGHRCRKTGFRFRAWPLEDGIPPDCPLEDAPRWVPVGEEMPKTDPERDYCSEDMPVMAGGQLHLAWFTDLDGLSDWCSLEDTSVFEDAQAVTHWLRGMPEMPKEGTNAAE